MCSFLNKYCLNQKDKCCAEHLLTINIVFFLFLFFFEKKKVGKQAFRVKKGSVDKEDV